MTLTVALSVTDAPGAILVGVALAVVVVAPLFTVRMSRTMCGPQIGVAAVDRGDGVAPTASAEVVKVAVPPDTLPVPSVVAPSLNVTVPVGVPEAGDVTATVAVKVTD